MAPQFGFKIAPVACLALALSTGMAFAQGKPWRHGIIEAKSDSGILYMASKRDYAKSLGLNLDFMQVKTDAIGLKALLAGELDSYEGGAGGAIVAAARGADVRVVGCHWLAVPHGVFVKKSISSLADLKGKSVAVSSPGTFPEQVAKAAFAKAGIPVTEVKLAAMGSDTDRFKALAAGVVDGAVISNEVMPIAEKQGIKLLVPGSEAAPNFVRICQFSTAKVVKERGEDLAKFLAAEMEGLRFAMGHRDETVALTREITGAKADDPRPGFVFDNALATKAIGTDLPLPLDKLDFMQKELVAAGNMPKAIDIAKAVDGGPRERALAILGK